MNGFPQRLTRSAALAAVVLAAGGAAASDAFAAPPVLALQGGELTYAADVGADVDDKVTFDPGIVNGVAIVDVRAAANMTLHSSAAGICAGGSSNVIRCEAADVAGYRAQLGDGDDTATVLSASGAEPLRPLFAAGGAGADTLTGGAAEDALGGGDDGDTIDGNGGDDTIVGEGGLDALGGGAGDDLVFGDDFPDDVFLAPMPAAAFAPGGTGTRAAGGASAGSGGAPAGGGTTSAADTTPAGDMIVGDSGDDSLHGGGGSDAVVGGSGDDRVTGDVGADDLSGGEGADTLEDGPGNDRLGGGEGDDLLSGDVGSDLLDGGSGADVADYGGRHDDLVLSLDGGAVANDGAGDDDADGAGPSTARDALVAIETLRGGDGDDRLSSTEEGRTLSGGAGDDTLLGGPLSDVLHGGAGDDLLIGDGGLDAWFGGAGDDELRSDDGIPEPNLDCGAGDGDRLQRDPGDAAAGCEQIADVLPVQPGPTDPGDPGTPGDPGAPAPPPAALQPAAQEPAPPHSELPAPDPVILVKLARGRGGSRVTKLVVRAVPERSTVTLTCSSPRRGACPFRRVRSRHRHGADRLDLRPRLRGRRLPPGTVLRVRVSDRLGDLAVRRVAIRR